MQLRPRYDGPPVFAIDGAIDDQREPFVRQRRRLQDALATLTHDQWQHPSRCEGWSVQDVVAHLIGTNTFWAMSIVAGCAGAPTRLLGTFDPVATPERMVAPMRAMSPSDVLAQFVDTNRALFDAVEALDADGWSALAESPVGHVSVRLLAHHALWDAWIHERDILLPLGITQVEMPDEIVPCLRYVCAIAPALALVSDPGRAGTLAVDAVDPRVQFVVEVDTTVAVRTGTAPGTATTLTGRAVDLIEMLSFRAPFDHDVPEDGRWLFEGLANVFDTRVEHA